MSGGRRPLILLVEDSAPVREAYAILLEESGYAVIEAGEGAGALKVLQGDRRVDLLITDVGLPGGMNGRQLADAARLARPDLKVLFVTGYAETAVMRGGELEAGMQVITKPFNLSALGAKVRELLDG